MTLLRNGQTRRGGATGGFTLTDVGLPQNPTPDGPNRPPDRPTAPPLPLHRPR